MRAGLAADGETIAARDQPERVITEKEARAWRYLDGTRVFGVEGSEAL